jgi:BirA family biotin operon repressor/biotin-[acetyl-CoA-carboxylase] ligase
LAAYVGAVDSPFATDPVGWSVTHVAETGSTNDDLAAAARAGAPDRTVLVADHQTAGRGRLGRRWEAPPAASLLISVLIRPRAAIAAGRLHGVTQAVGLAARRACTDVAGFTPVLKWPNDLLVDDRKLAGILAEAVADGGHVVAVVVGMGLNVAWPETPTADAVSAAAVAGRPVDRGDLLSALLKHLDGHLGQWEDDPEALREDYRDALATIGRHVRVETPSGPLEGVAVDVGPAGELLLDAGGRRHAIAVGDVIHLR